MQLSASMFLALRYLRPKKSVVTVITMLSVLGPVLGVTTLMVVIAVMEGMGLEIRSRIFGMQAHLQVQAPGDDHLPDPAAIMAILEAHGLRATPTTEGPVLVQLRRDIHAKMLRGIELESDRDVTILQDSIQAGRLPSAAGEVAIGEQLAWDFSLGLGSNMVVHPTGQLKQMVRVDEDNEVVVEESSDYQPTELQVVGIFRAGMYDFDAGYLLTDLPTAAELFALPQGAAKEVRAVTDDPFAVDPVVAELRADERLHGLDLLTWQEANQQLFDALRVEKTVQFFVLTIIVVVAAFSIMAMLITVVIRKAPEIGVMKAMGATPWAILRVFMYQGAIVGLLGVIGGTLVGGALLAVRDHIARLMWANFQLQILPTGTPRIPAVVRPGDVLVIALIAFAISLVAAILPALYAALIRPTQALASNDS